MPLQPGLPVVSGPPGAGQGRSWPRSGTEAFSTFPRREVRDLQAGVAPALGTCRENSGVSHVLAPEREGEGGGEEGAGAEREAGGGRGQGTDYAKKKKKSPNIPSQRGSAAALPG